jgi:hypothetical protein
MFLIHQPSSSAAVSRALAPSVQALPWPEFLTQILAWRILG